MGSPSNPLAARRFLLGVIALLSALTLGAWILWPAGAERGTALTPERNDARESPALSAATSASSTTSPATRSPSSGLAAVALDREPMAEAHDPTAIVGQLLCEGLPVAEAELYLFAVRPLAGEPARPLLTTRSDAHGGFRLEGLESHVPHALLVQHPEHLPEEVTVFAGTHENLVLRRAVTVSGTVLARPDDRPLAGVTVTLRRRHLGPAGMEERVSTTSDAQGRWRLPWAEAGIQSFDALRTGHLPQSFRFQVSPGGNDGYVLALDEPRAGLELELHLLESGALLADAELLSEDTPVRTDSRGRLVLPHPLDLDGMPLALELVGGCLTQGRLKSSAAAGSVLRVPLARGGSVRGRVLDEAGLPVADAELHLSGGGRVPLGPALPEGLGLESARGAARSDADGRFELRGLAPREGPVTVQALHPRHPPGHSAPFVFARLGDAVEVEIRLERGGSVTGIARLDGQPAALRVVWSSDGASGWTRAGEHGSYGITGIPAGELLIGARREDDDHEGERPGDLWLFLEEGDSLVADLELRSENARIRGLVRDALGTPVAGAAVRALLPKGLWGEEPHTASDSDGRFVLPVPDAPGLAFVVVAEHGLRQVRTNAVRAGDDELELILPALAPLSLRVLDASRREPLQDFQIHWRDAAGGSFQRLVQGHDRFAGGPDGTFLAELPLGRLDLVVSARGGGYLPSRRDAIEFRGPGHPTVEFALVRGVELELVLVVAPEARDDLLEIRRLRTFIASEEQWAEQERGGSWFSEEVRGPQSLRPDADGVVRLEAMPVGRYRFLDKPRSLILDPPEFDVPATSGRHRIQVNVRRASPDSEGEGVR